MATLTYNGYSLPNIINKIKYDETYANIRISVDFLIIGASVSDLISQYNTAQAKLTERNKDLVLSFGKTPSGELNYSHTSNTGFLSEGYLQKIDSVLSTEQTRHCAFICNIKLPFDQLYYNYRQNASFDINYMPTKQKLVTFNVTYTAGGSNSAYQNYNLHAKTWCESILARFSSTFEIVKENISEEQEEKILNATIVYKEIISNQIGSIKDDPKLVDIRISYKTLLGQESGHPVSAVLTSEVSPGTSIQIDFSCPFNKDLTADNLIAKYYHDTIRPYILSKTREYLNLSEYDKLNNSTLYVETEEYSVDNHISVLIGKIKLSIPSLTNFILFNEKYTKFKDEKLTTVKLWDGENDTYSIWTTGSSTIVSRIITLGKYEQSPLEPASLESNLYLLLNREVTKVNKKLGQNTKDTGLTNDLIFYMVVIKETYLYVSAFTKIVEKYNLGL